MSDLTTDPSDVRTGGVATDDAPWWRSAVVYQIYPRSFADSDGDGIGDLRGIIQRLDHLQRLGVDVIWLSPIYSSPGDDNGYDISDYQAIDPVYGTLDDFDRLLEEVHARGMKLVMDLVVNHTSDEHPWFVESASGIGSAKRDWYWWRPPRDGFAGGEPGAEPNNWGSFFSGSAWQYDRDSGEYFLHLFSRKQPDLNWENPEVREAIYEMMNWWLDRGVDGFRMDVINFLSKEASLPDGKVPPRATYGDGFPFYAGGPRIHEFLQEMNRRVFAHRTGAYLTVGEMPGVTVEEARLFTDPQRAEVDMVFQFEHVGLDHGPDGKFDPGSATPLEVKESLVRWQEGLSDVGWNSLYWNNHDQPRVVSRFGDDGVHWRESATALATVLHLLRGTPYIFQGEELGMTNMPFTRIEDFRDIESLNHYADALATHGRSPDDALAALHAMSRDNARTPVQWSAEPNGGFTTGEPWITVNPNFTHINAVAQAGDPRSVLSHYKALVALRHEERVVSDGSFRLLLDRHPTVFAYVRSLGNRQMLVLANLSGEPAAYDLEEVDAWRGASLLLTNSDAPSPVGDGRLGPWEAQVLVRG
ncbi:glycoside hydrolase family 13 protein [Leifsonia virtsii]|uniref:Alpha-glucosidase n=1 Tax=Leifsonia virtsii TaxID=3035915 RepID=A0ABT8IWJ4_9MICO|nr:alpha-glucosidase [Leifsonia virtsii]MDN4597189.1 alpha-glucosidase [Leifsonia virtsii]